MADCLTKINAIIENEVIHKDRLTKLNGMIESEIDHHDRLTKIVAMVEYLVPGKNVIILPSISTVAMHSETVNISPYGRR